MTRNEVNVGYEGLESCEVSSCIGVTHDLSESLPGTTGFRKSQLNPHDYFTRLREGFR